jgi:sugar lactone lactonase YvrE
LGSGSSGSVDGDGNTMGFYEPTGLYPYKGSLFVSDTGGNIRQLTLDPGANIRSRANWHSATLAGPSLGAGFADGSGVDAMFNSPFSLAVDYSGNILVADVGNNRIRQVTPTNGRFPFEIGGGASTGVDEVRLANPTDFVPGGANSDPTPYILEDQTIEPLGIAELTSWDLIVPEGVKHFEFTVTIEAETDTIAPPDAVNNPGPSVGNGSPRAIVRTLSGVTTAGYANGNVSSAAYAAPTSFAYDAQGNLFVADADNRAIRRITPAGQVSTVAGAPTNAASAGDGHGGVAGFGVVAGVAVNAAGDVVYVTDSTNNTVRRIALTGSDSTKAFDWTVTTIAGLAGPVGYAEGPGTVARFSKPWGIVLTTGGDLVISEATGNRLRRLQAVGPNPASASDWVVSLVAGETTSASPNAGYQDGTGAAVRFTDPRGLALAASGEIYVAERGNHKIRSVNVAGTVKTFGGSTGGFGDSDFGSQAKFNAPMDVAVDRAGYVYVADTANRVIRRISPNGAVRTIAGGNQQGGVDGPGNVARFSILNGIEVSPAGDVVAGDAMRIRLVERLISSGIVG